VGLKYTNVDRTEDPAFCIRFMDAMRSLPEVQAGRARAEAMVGLRSGIRVLELGSGTGDQARELALRVVPDGEVVAVDYSQAMVSLATARHGESGLPLTFEQGDVCDLRFPAGSFDACWTERMLCHLPDPSAALAEIARVLKPGGRLLAIDGDATATVVDCGDPALSAAMVAAIAAQTEHPAMGRELPTRLGDAGFVDVAVHPYLCRLPDEMVAAMAVALRPVLIEAEAVAADREGSSMTVPLLAVVGTKPPAT